jgi:hypothetical protein
VEPALSVAQRRWASDAWVFEESGNRVLLLMSPLRGCGAIEKQHGPRQIRLSSCWCWWLRKHGGHAGEVPHVAHIVVPQQTCFAGATTHSSSFPPLLMQFFSFLFLWGGERERERERERKRGCTARKPSTQAGCGFFCTLALNQLLISLIFLLFWYVVVPRFFSPSLNPPPQGGLSEVLGEDIPI